MIRQLRPPVLAAAAVTAASTAVVLTAAGVVRRWLDARGTPGCLDPNVCYPAGSALDAVLAMELTAAFVPALLGLILGVPLATRAGNRPRAVAVALGAGLLCSAVVAVTHRLVATRYTLLANDTYELLQLPHLNNVALMVAQTALVVAIAAVLAPACEGRPVRAALLTAALWPFGLVTACGAVALLSPVLGLWHPAPSPAPSGDFTADVGLADPLAYTAAGILAVCVLGLLLLARRLHPHHRPAD